MNIERCNHRSHFDESEACDEIQDIIEAALRISNIDLDFQILGETNNLGIMITVFSYYHQFFMSAGLFRNEPGVLNIEGQRISLADVQAFSNIELILQRSYRRFKKKNGHKLIDRKQRKRRYLELKRQAKQRREDAKAKRWKKRQQGRIRTR